MQNILIQKQGLLEIKKLKTLNQYLEKFITYCDENGINASELADLKNLRTGISIPFHTTILEHQFLNENLTSQNHWWNDWGILSFQFYFPAAANYISVLIMAEDRQEIYKIELQENLRYIKSIDGNILLSPIIQCYEWTQNGQIHQVAWTMNGDNPLKLISFYNNKLNHLLHHA